MVRSDTLGLFLILERNHPVFHYVSEGFDHLSAVSVSSASSEPLPMTLVAVPQTNKNEEVDSKGPFLSSSSILHFCDSALVFLLLSQFP